MKKQGEHKEKNRVMAAKKRLAQKYARIEAQRVLENEREMAYMCGLLDFDGGTVACVPARKMCAVYSFEVGTDTRQLVTREEAYDRLHNNAFVTCIWDAEERVYVYYSAAKKLETKLARRI